MANRTAKIERNTNETSISLDLNLDGTGTYELNSGIGFLDHMLSHLSKHGKIDLSLKAKGDLEVDDHHTVEDIAICIGGCFNQALGDKKGIARYANCSVPMEDALVNVAVDLSGRAFCIYNAKYPTEKIGNFDVECIEEFIRAFTSNAMINLHVNVIYGTNSHHIAEAVFKAIGQALAKAIQITGSDIPSTKGTL